MSCIFTLTVQDITHSHGSAGLGASKSTKNRKISSASVFEVLDESKELAKNKDLPTSTLYSSTSGTLNKRLPFHNEKENVMALGTLKNTKVSFFNIFPDYFFGLLVLRLKDIS